MKNECTIGRNARAGRPPNAPIPVRPQADTGRPWRRWLAPALLAGLLAGSVQFAVAAPNADFNVGLNTTATYASTIRPGGETSLRITLTNSDTGAALTSVAFSQALPSTATGGLRVSGAAVVSTDPATSTGSCSGSVTAVVGGTAVSLSGMTIPPSDGTNPGRCYIDLPVQAWSSNGLADTHAYALAAEAVNSDQGSNATGGSQSITVLAVQRPTWTKSFEGNDAVAVLGGSGTTLRIVVRNPDSVVTLDGVSFVDIFPTAGGDGAVIEPTGAGVTTSGCGASPSVVPTAGAAAQVAVSGVSIAAGGSCTINVPVRARHTDGEYQLANLTNTVLASSFTSNQGLRPSANASDEFTVRSPLSVGKSFASGYVANGQPSGFTITLGNSSTTPISVTSFADDPIDSGGVGGQRLTVTGAVNSCGGSVSTTANGVTTGGFSIPANGSCAIDVTFTGVTGNDNAPTTYTNSIGKGAVVNTTPGIVSQARTATVTIVDELRVLKSRSPAAAAPGNPVKYSVTVQNYSSSPIASVHVVDVLQNNASYLTGIHNGTDYSPTLSAACGTLGVAGSAAGGSPGTLDFTIQTLPARTGASTPGQCTIEFWAMTDKNGSSGTTNTIASCGVYYGTQAPPYCNSVAPAPVSVNHQAVVAVNKTFADLTSVTRPEGTVVKMRIEVSNYSDRPLSTLSIGDTFPAPSALQQLRVATPANAGTTCGGTVNAVADGTSISLNGASVPARNAATNEPGRCELYVDVVGPAGTYNNTATVSATQTYADGSTAAISGVASNTATVIYDPVLTATKAFNPTAVSSGGTSRVTVRLTNSSASAVTGVQVTDPLPNSGGQTMVLADPPNLYSTCGGSKIFSGVAGGSSVSMSGAVVPANASCDLLFDVVATGSANWVNTIAPGGITADGGIASQSPVSATLNFAAPNVPTVSKGIVPPAVAPGEQALLTITVTASSQALSNLGLTDYFTVDGSAGGTPNGMRIASPAGASTTCPGGVVTAVPGSTRVSLAGASLAASQACEVSVQVTSAAVGAITNVIPLHAISTDQGVSNSSTTGSATLQTNSVIGVSKSFTPRVTAVGERSRLRITVLNPLSQPLANFGLVDTLPAGLTVPAGPNIVQTCGTASITTPGSTQVRIANGTLAGANGGVPSACYVELDVQGAAEGDYVNTIVANTLTEDGQTVSHPPATDTLSVRRPLDIHKAIAGRTLDSGNPAGFTTGIANGVAGTGYTLTVVLHNPNTSAVSGMGFTDTFPEGLVADLAGTSANTCGGTLTLQPSARSFRLAGASLGAGASCTVSLPVLSNQPGSYTNIIAAGEVRTSEGLSNGERTSATLVVASPPTVAKQFAPPVIAAGGISRLTIFVGNSNDSSYTLTAALVDNLPLAGNVRVAATPNIGGSCPAGNIIAVAGSGTVTLASGTTVPAGGCTVELDVTADQAGVHNNNIPKDGLQTSVGNNQDAANATLTVSTQGYVSGKVFRDNNTVPNGVFDAGIDTPIAGASIELRSGAGCAGPLVGGVTNPVLTDSQGNYLFAGLLAGSYSVCQVGQPAGTLNGITTAGGIAGAAGSTGSAGTAANPTATRSQITGVVLNADGSAGETSGSPGNNFAEVATSIISGVVFLDQANDGVQNGSDAGIAGVVVELLNGGGTVVAITTTAADGSYAFSGLAPGTYSVREPNQPAGTANGITTAGAVGNGGSAGTASGVNVTPSVIAGIVLPPNTTAAANNFAEIPNTRTISGRIFLDFNNNGVADGNDHGIGGQIVNLTGNDINGNPVSLSATTTADGSYSFSGVPEGSNYTVTQPSQPAGTTNGQTLAGSTGGSATAVGVTPSAISGINLAGSNRVSAENNFAEIPGAAPDLSIAKTHTPINLGEGSTTGHYTITPGNIGAVDTSGMLTIVDTLPAGITALGTPTGSGWSCTVAGQTVTCTGSGVISAGGSGNPITLRVAVAAGTAGQILTNTAVISGGGEPAGFEGNNTAVDPTPIASSASVQGTVWRDYNHNRVRDPGEPVVAGWGVELLLNGSVVATTTTNASGAYAFTGVAPGSGYQIRFREPTSGAVFGSAVPNEQGASFVDGVVDASANPAGAVTTDGTLSNLTLAAGTNTVEQSLPLDPQGVVYDAVTRQPVAGAVVTLGGPAGFEPFVLGGSISQTTGSNGMYQFLLIPGAPAGVYTLTVTVPAGYVPGPSTLIPACVNTPSVGAVPAPALVVMSDDAPATSAPLHDAQACEASISATAVSTQYYLSFVLAPGTSANVLNNHIPLDPVLGGAIRIVKTSPLVSVSKGGLVPYTITATNTLSAALGSIDVVDQVPPGFKYRSGSASVRHGGGSVFVPAEPKADGRVLNWQGQNFAAGESKTYRVVLVVGAGVGEGEYTNLAWAMNDLVGERVSNIGSAVVRVIPDPVFDCSDIIGKVFDDKNANGYQDEGEAGIPNVRVVTARGLLITTDAEGRFHVTCADIPQQDRGSNFVMKLDERTLPSGYRVTTENPRDVRTTRGKMVKLNFGATVHKVFRVEVDARAFAEGNTLAPAWAEQLRTLVPQLAERPSVARLAYRLGNAAEADTAKDRLDILGRQLQDAYRDKGGEGPPLVVETEIIGVAGGAQGERQ